MAAETPTTTPPLTPAGIEKLPQGEYRDTAAPGLFLRVNKRSRTFRWYVRSIGRAITIGPWSKTSRPRHVTLGEAHVWLERLKEAHQEGRLEQVEAELQALRTRRKPEIPPTASPALLVKTVAEDFLQYLERCRRRPEAARRTFNVDILPALGERPIREVEPAEIRRVVEGVVGRGSRVQAGHVLALLRQFFGFAVDRDDLQVNPADRFKNPRALGVEKNTSQRVLSDEELVAFWKALDRGGMTPTVRGALRLLLLLGVRAGELLQAEWSEFDLEQGLWSVPPAHRKMTLRRERTARTWVVPLPPRARAILGELKALADSIGSKYVLASFHPTAKGAALTEKALNHAVRRLFTGEAPALRSEGERPTPHDLRRTCRTGLSRLGVPWHVGERVLGHSLGKVADIYDRADLLDERGAALEKWATYVDNLLSPATAKVAFLETRVGS
jgi:integrase